MRAVQRHKRYNVQLALVPMHSQYRIILPLRRTTVTRTSLLRNRTRVKTRASQVKSIPTVRTTRQQTIIIIVVIIRRFVIHKMVQVPRMEHTMILLRNLPIRLLNRTPQTTRMILNANTTSHQMFTITISVRLRLTFTPPMPFRHNRHRVNARVLPQTTCTVRRRVVVTRLNRPLTAPLHVRMNNVK